MGKFLKSGEEVLCNIKSQDLWVTVKIKCLQLQLSIMFEIKVNFSCNLHQFNEVILDHAYNLLYQYDSNV